MSEVEKKRESSIELYRIVLMLIIVAHHYVVNSGLYEKILNDEIGIKQIFLLIFGWGGKTGINCFILITGYFMCKSQITLKKFLKIFLEVEFYTILIYIIFVMSGVVPFSLKEFGMALIPISGIGTGFTHSYLIFYMFIPFINVLVERLNKDMYKKLLGLCLLVFSILPNLTIGNTSVNYIVWFIIVYLFGAYLRQYYNQSRGKFFWGMSTVISLVLSWASVVCGAIVGERLGKDITYFFVADSNKLLALVTAICSFMFFKNLNIKYNKIINVIAASTFGVFQLHANSSAMREWLWGNVCKNIEVYNSNDIYVHAFSCVLIIFVVCTVIDIIRIKFIESPLFRFLEIKFQYK